MQKNIIGIVILSIFLFGGISVLAENVPTSGVGITPDSPFYIFKTLKENIQTFFTFGAENKAKQFLHLADVRLAEYQKMIEKGTLRQAQGKKLEIAQKTLDKYEKQLNRAIQKAEELKGKGKDVKDISERIASATAKHVEVLENNLQKVPESAKKGLEKAIENAKKISKTEDETAGWKTYGNGNYGFEIKYPLDWKTAADFPGRMGPGQTDFQEGINPKSFDFAPNSKDLSIAFNGDIILYVAPSGVNCSSSANLNAENVKSFLEQNNNKSEIEFCKSSAYFRLSLIGTQKEIFNQMLSTFRFLPPQ